MWIKNSEILPYSCDLLSAMNYFVGAIFTSRHLGKYWLLAYNAHIFAVCPQHVLLFSYYTGLGIWTHCITFCAHIYILFLHCWSTVSLQNGEFLSVVKCLAYVLSRYPYTNLTLDLSWQNLRILICNLPSLHCELMPVTGFPLHVTTYCQILVKLSSGILYKKKVSRKPGLLENWLRDVYALLKGINQFFTHGSQISWTVWVKFSIDLHRVQLSN